VFKSLRHGFLLGLIGLAVGPIVFVVIFSGRTIFTTLENQNRQLLQDTADRVSSDIDHFFKDAQTDVNFIDRIAGIAGLKPDKQQALLQGLLLGSQVYQELHLIDRGGRDVVGVSRTIANTADTKIDWRSREAFHVPVGERNTYFGPVQFDEHIREPLITMSSPLANARSGEIAYVLVSTLRFKPIWNLLANIELRKGEDAYVVNREGRVVAHRNPTVVLRHAKIARVPASRTIGLSGEDALSVVVEQTTASAQAIRNNITGVFKIVSALALASSIFFFFLFVRKIVTPLGRLGAAAREMSGGTYPDEMKSFGLGEVGALGRAFNKMVADIRESRGKNLQFGRDLEAKNILLSQEIENLEQAEQEQKRLKEELAAQAGLLNTTIDSMGQGCAVYDADLTLVRHNAQFEKIFYFPPGFLYRGISQRELIRYRVERGDFGPGDIDEIVKERVQRTQNYAAERSAERTLPNGRTHIHFREPMPDGGHVTTYTDITERRQLEAQLVAAQKMEAVGQLTGGVAHDFNNLLAVVHANAELLINLKSPADRPLAEAILRASERGAELTQRLLAYSRKQPLQSKPIDLGILVNSMGEMLARTIGETIAIQTKRAPELWLAMADPGQVENAVLNLTINARDAMPKGGTLIIACSNVVITEDSILKNSSVVEAGEYVVLAVTDTGTGMSEDVKMHALDPFFTTKEVGAGSGLGLSMIYGFAKQTGGNVTIDSAEGRGTTVKVFLPRATELAKKTSGEAEESDPEIQHGEQEVVLLIEDNLDVQTALAAMLRSLDYRVVAVSAASEAWVAIEREKKVDIVLSDVVLPGGVSGFKFTEESSARMPELKVILMSGYAQESAENLADFSPGKILLDKPFTRKQLADVMWAALH
jgi:signal transduction histidine kinase